MCRPTRRRFRGRLTRLGETSEDDAQSLHRGGGGSTYTRKARLPHRGFERVLPAESGVQAMDEAEHSVERRRIRVERERFLPGGLVTEARQAVQLAPGSADVAQLAGFILIAAGYPED